jgi:hypothetical protein
LTQLELEYEVVSKDVPRIGTPLSEVRDPRPEECRRSMVRRYLIVDIREERRGVGRVARTAVEEMRCMI